MFQVRRGRRKVIAAEAVADILEQDGGGFSKTPSRLDWVVVDWFNPRAIQALDGLGVGIVWMAVYRWDPGQRRREMTTWSSS